MTGEAPRGGVSSRHRHPTPVHGFVLEGSWRYLEHDRVAEAGAYVFEPPGEEHTLTVDEGEMRTFFYVDGPVLYVDDDDNATYVEDNPAPIRQCRKHCEQVGLGAGFVDRPIRWRGTARFASMLTPPPGSGVPRSPPPVPGCRPISATSPALLRAQRGAMPCPSPRAAMLGGDGAASPSFHDGPPGNRPAMRVKRAYSKAQDQAVIPIPRWLELVKTSRPERAGPDFHAHAIDKPVRLRIRRSGDMESPGLQATGNKPLT